MNRLCLILSVLLLTTPAASETSWGAHPVWDDGKAEVAVYASDRVIYGQERTGDAVFITVKEDFNAATYTKADPPYAGKDLLPVLKLNIASGYRTENYPYHFLTSVFVNRNDVRDLYKLTTSSQEWCGNTFKMIRTWDGPPELHYHSYWEDQSDGAYPIPASDARLLEDQIVISLRSLPFAPGYREAVTFVRSFIGNRAPEPDVLPAAVEVVGREAVTVPAGTFGAWRVTITGEGLEQTCWFEASHPNILLRWESGDGRSLSLKQRERRTYW